MDSTVERILDRRDIRPQRCKSCNSTLQMILCSCGHSTSNCGHSSQSRRRRCRIPRTDYLECSASIRDPAPLFRPGMAVELEEVLLELAEELLELQEAWLHWMLE